MTSVVTQRDSRAAPPEDLHEYRAYLQRGETRLSTLHRVAGAFLGGAGLLTLLPVLFRDTFSMLFSQLLFLPDRYFPQPGDVTRWTLLVPVVLSLALPLWALYLLMRDLVRFYFTGNSFGSDNNSAVTYPRFILSGIRVSEPSLHNDKPLLRARESPAVINLLVPASAAARGRLLREAHLIGRLNGIDLASRKPDAVKAKLKEFLFDYTGSDRRSLADEAAQMEASLARHNMLLRVLVLRYAKAFLLTILTTGSTIIALVALNFALPDTREQLTGSRTTDVLPGYILWVGLLSVYAAWCLAAAFVVRRPVVWIHRDLNDDTRALRTPQSLLLFEAVTLASVAFGSLATGVSLVWYAVVVTDVFARILAVFSALALVPVTVVYAVLTIWRSLPSRVASGKR